MSNFRPTDRKTDFLMPPSVDEWLPARHLARFVVEVVERAGPALDDRELPWLGFGLVSPDGAAEHSGVRLRHRRVLQPQAGTRHLWDFVAFRFIAGNEHPDHDTIATFRRRFLKQIETLFVEVLKLAREDGRP